MKILTESPRFYLREIKQTDIQDLFEMDSDPEVHRYIENKPVKTIQELTPIIENLQKQYLENGIARWAVIDKTSGEMVGWCGLKFFKNHLNNHTHFYELGYRFKQKHWQKGFATESSIAVINYGFAHLDINDLFAITHPENKTSQHVLQKLGFRFQETFDDEGEQTFWYTLNKEDWNNKQNH